MPKSVKHPAPSSQVAPRLTTPPCRFRFCAEALRAASASRKRRFRLKQVSASIFMFAQRCPGDSRGYPFRSPRLTPRPVWSVQRLGQALDAVGFQLVQQSLRGGPERASGRSWRGGSCGSVRPRPSCGCPARSGQGILRGCRPRQVAYRPGATRGAS